MKKSFEKKKSIFLLYLAIHTIVNHTIIRLGFKCTLGVSFAIRVNVFNIDLFKFQPISIYLSSALLFCIYCVFSRCLNVILSWVYHVVFFSGNGDRRYQYLDSPFWISMVCHLFIIFLFVFNMKCLYIVWKEFFIILCKAFNKK